MSAELPPEDERGGDVIRIKGMNVPERFPLLAQHVHAAPDGSPTVIGSVVEHKLAAIDWKGKSIPAMLGRFEWANTELAGKYKQLWPEHINTVSIGAMVYEAEPFEKGNPWGGYDITESELFELSVVTVPANPAAGALRAIRNALAGELDFAALPESVQVVERIEELEAQIHTIEEHLDAIAKVVSKGVASVVDRLDNLEDAVVASSVHAPVTSDPKAGAPSDDLAKLRRKLDEVLTRIP